MSTGTESCKNAKPSFTTLKRLEEKNRVSNVKARKVLIPGENQEKSHIKSHIKNQSKDKRQKRRGEKQGLKY